MKDKLESGLQLQQSILTDYLNSNANIAITISFMLLLFY